MIWLSSFPRSGNTFLRNILFEVYGLESSTFHRESTYPLDENFSAYPFVKTHELPSSLVEFEPDIPSVYLVRDGRDALCSIAHHRSDIIAPGSDYEQNLKAAIVAESGSFFGGWSKNTLEWLARADLVIRYEDLIRDPISAVERLRAIYPLPQPQIENLPSFESQKFGIPKYGSKHDHDVSEQDKREQSGKFFRRGKAGSWKDDMPEHLQDLFWSHHGDTMEKLGYSYDGGVHEPNPLFDSVLRAKLGFAPQRAQQKQYRVVIESDKIVSPDNDGVKRYQVELLKALFPVVENPESQWEIDLYIHGKIHALRDCRELVFKSFSTPDDRAVEQLGIKVLTSEQKLVATVPRGLVNFLAKYNITVFHTTYEVLKELFLRLVTAVTYRPSLGKAEISAAPSAGCDKELDSYDLVHLPLKQHYAAFVKFQGSILMTIHDLTHLIFPEFHTKKNIDNAEKGMKFAVDREANLIAISQSTMKDIFHRTTVARDRVHLIYEAADRSRFNVQVNTDECRRVRQKYKLHFDEPYLICLSTLEPRKNLKNTVAAYVLLRQGHPDIPLKLVIAGKKGWNVGSIYQAAREYSEHIFFTGFVDDEDLPYLYSGALAMSYLSFYEGFGLPPLEAMCCGTPVIYGNNSSLVEVVAEGGLPADPQDVNDIKEQYEKIFYDSGLRDRKASAALKQSLKFSWRDTAIRTLELYEQIIKENT